MNPVWEYTIKLIRFVLNGDVPEQPENIDYEELFAFGKSHGVENMLYAALRDLNIDVPEETMQKFKTAYEMQIMVEATQALEFEAIAKKFELLGIDFAVFKGTLLRYLYPMPDYRKSGDIDIIVKDISKEKMDKIMVDLGYDVDDCFDEYEVHDAYTKKPFIEVEIHKQLLKTTNRAYEFCLGVWEHSKPKIDGSHQYIMGNEFMYIYLLAHLCNHLYMGGAGIRILMDFYVVRRKVRFNEKLLAKYLKRTRLTELNNMVMKLIEKWFGDNYKTEQDAEILENIVFKNGSFGSSEMHDIIISSNTRTNKLYNVCQKLFVSADMLKGRYPILEQKPCLLPFFWIYRVFDIGFHERDTVHEKMKVIVGDNAKTDKNIKNIVKAVRDDYRLY